MNSPAPMSRREFLRGTVRNAAAGGLLVGTSLLVLQKTSDSCPKPVECTRCAAFGGCTLDRAIGARRGTSSRSRQASTIAPEGR